MIDPSTLKVQDSSQILAANEGRLSFQVWGTGSQPILSQCWSKHARWNVYLIAVPLPQSFVVCFKNGNVDQVRLFLLTAARLRSGKISVVDI